MKFGYARVSKDDQNLDLQIDALRKYGVDEIYTEKITGTKQNRQQLTELLNKLRAGDTLVIWKLDRLGRTTKQLLALAEDFQKRGINFVSITENFDTSTPSGKFVFHIFCAMIQMERDVISERTLAGLAAARKRGRRGGRKPKDKKSIERALKMYFSNEFTIKDIEEATGLSKTTLYKYVREYKDKNGKE
ncbi:recombinase family protein [Defluviitalea phaphyphila]|uniref:recombinase family protein n=1 Tax=Defluviitalea phaphyphila TaxID=1473580 RepID=UPI00073195B1|nr:recombinase family protein [Defluviitalea phaphyphila]